MCENTSKNALRQKNEVFHARLNFYDPVEKCKNGQNAHHSIESMLLSQSPTIKIIKFD